MSKSVIEIEFEHIKECFDEIANAVGKEKLSVIRKVWPKYNTQWALETLLDPTVSLHIKERSLCKDIPLMDAVPYDHLIVMCNDLYSKKALKDSDIARVQATLNQIEDYRLRNYAEKFLCKSISLGISAKTVNKAVGYGVLPVMEVMLANKYFDHPDVVNGKEFTITEKLDGIRCIAIVEQGKQPVLLSRQGQLIEGLHHVEAALDSMRCHVGYDFVFDGELLVTNRNDYPSKEQYKQTTKIVRKDGPKSGITYNVFDIISVRNYLWHTPTQSYLCRRDTLDEMFQGFYSVWLKPLPVLYCGNNVDVIHECLEEQRSLDHEGIMINLNDAPYVFGRTSNLLKVKVMSDCDLEIIGVQEGKGKFEGTLGALTVDYKGSPVGVGSGLTDEMRAAIWADPDKYIGRVATIQYFEETNDADGKLSIRFPVFKELREVGKEVSYS